MEEQNMINELKSTWDFIQMKIYEIKSLLKIDIKQISDLQRYVEMQRNIAEAITLLEKRG